MAADLKAFNRLAVPERWFDMARQVIPLLDNPAASGFKTAAELLSALAAGRKQTHRGLGKQVEAARFVLQTYPDLVNDFGVEGGHSQIEFLSKIHKIDPREADRLAPRVLAGGMTMDQMRAAYAECVDKTRSGGPASAVAARMRAFDFERTCVALMRRHPEVFGARSADEIKEGCRIGRFSLDGAVVRDGRVLVGMESRVGGTLMSPRDALPLLARFALLLHRLDTVWLLVPQWAERFAEAVRDEAREWDVTGIRVALVNEGGTEPNFVEIT
jgi:hypothetical protein